MGKTFGKRNAGPDSSPPIPSKDGNSRIALTSIFIVTIAVVGYVVLGSDRFSTTGNQNTAADQAVSVDESMESYPPADIGRMWVTSDRLDLRSCPLASCGVSNRLIFREAAEVLEIRGNWGRVSRYILAPCVNGRTSYLTGNNACSSGNGFVGERYAQWAELAYLSPVRPDDPGAGATGAARLVAQSDDFRHHEAVFVKAAQDLIRRGRCTEEHFLRMGGWYWSPDEPSIYFTYCGQSHIRNRYFLDVSTGRIFQ